MQKVLIVIESEELRLALAAILKTEYELLVCAGAEEAQQLLSQKPDGMILDLHLQETDGLTFLENTKGCHPPVILVLTKLLSDYIEQALNELKVGYILRIPAPLNTIALRLQDMFRKYSAAAISESTGFVRYHLQRLGLRSDRVGYSRLLTAITLFASDPQQTLFNDIYPVIAKETGSNCNAIDNAIHDLIRSAWLYREEEIWAEYFPNCNKCPRNKNFIAVLSEYL